MIRLLIILFSITLLSSCIPLKDLKYLQEDKNLELNEFGYIETNPTEYRLQIDDILAMNIFTRDPRFTQKFGDQYTVGVGGASDQSFYIRGLIIQEDGQVEIPRLGKVHIFGKTVDEAKEAIQNKFEEVEYKKGEITVKLQLSGILFTILGEVRSPGTRTIYRNRLNILEAIALAGDLSIVADRKHIKLLRKYPEGIRIVEVDITKESLMNSEFFYIQPNDQIIVNPKVQRTIGFGTNFAGTITTLAATLSGLISIIFIFQRF